ncbi:MAG: hypothetical protein QM755_02195 [Luteolibacter sp.]
MNRRLTARMLLLIAPLWVALAQRCSWAKADVSCFGTSPQQQILYRDYTRDSLWSVPQAFGDLRGHGFLTDPSSPVAAALQLYLAVSFVAAPLFASILFRSHALRLLWLTLTILASALLFRFWISPVPALRISEYLNGFWFACVAIACHITGLLLTSPLKSEQELPAVGKADNPSSH